MPKRDIVIVPFPFDDLRTVKPRPALCLTDHIGPFEHVIIAFISAQIPGEDGIEASDMVFNQKEEWFVDTGLKTTSVLRLHRLTTVAAKFIRRKLGELPPEQFMQALANVRMLFRK